MFKKTALHFFSFLNGPFFGLFLDEINFPSHTVNFRLQHAIHILKAACRVHLGYHRTFLVHPVMRQIFANDVKPNSNPKLTRCHNNNFLVSSCIVFLIHFWLPLYCVSECLSPSGVHLSPLSPLKSVSRGGAPYWTQADAISAYPEIELFFSKYFKKGQLTNQYSLVTRMRNTPFPCPHKSTLSWPLSQNPEIANVDIYTTTLCDPSQQSLLHFVEQEDLKSRIAND